MIFTQEQCKQYQEAKPFPHLVIRDWYVTRGIAEALAEQALNYPWETVEAKNNPNTRSKKALSSEFHGDFFYGESFLESLTELTGIKGLIPDPYFHGGGIHRVGPGGFLKMHTDFNYHPITKLDRRINLLLYLNKRWNPDWGGDLELWDYKTKKCVTRVIPEINTLAIFNTTDYSIHGHPEPLRCPQERARYALALYYYTNGRPLRERRLFRKRGHTTYY